MDQDAATQAASKLNLIVSHGKEVAQAQPVRMTKAQYATVHRVVMPCKEDIEQALGYAAVQLTQK